MRKTALYPGSFNPMHLGHISIVQWLCGSGMFDSVRVMLSPHNPFKSSLPPGTVLEFTESDRERIRGIREALRRHSLDVEVEDIEFTLPLPHYTYNTLAALRRREPDTVFALVTGADNLALIGRWYRGFDLLAEYELWVYPRSGYDAAAMAETLRREYEVLSLNIIDAPLVDISSSQIRRARSCGDNSLEQFEA